jgi:hypothetical protein
MQLLEFISVDRELKNYLAKNLSTSVETTSKNTIITNEDLPKVHVSFYICVNKLFINNFLKI